MSNNFTDFLIQVGENPVKFREFQKNPDLVMDAAGLSATQRAAILSRDSRKVLYSLESEGHRVYPVWVDPVQVVVQLRPSV